MVQHNRSYGFIEPDEGGSDALSISVPFRGWFIELVEGQAVEYDMAEAKNGKLCAMNIKVSE